MLRRCPHYSRARTWRPGRPAADKYDVRMSVFVYEPQALTGGSGGPRL